MTYRGIDYSGSGATCNRDSVTGIRYGIIPLNSLADWAMDEFEADYGPATCGKCGNECEVFYADKHEDYEHKSKHSCDDFACQHCELILGSSETGLENAEPQRWVYERNGYALFIDDSNDVWVTAAPYTTRAQFCSPCAPGACYLSNPCDDGAEAFCLGPDWFDEENPSPYVATPIEKGEVSA